MGVKSLRKVWSNMSVIILVLFVFNIDDEFLCLQIVVSAPPPAVTDLVTPQASIRTTGLSLDVQEKIKSTLIVSRNNYHISISFFLSSVYPIIQNKFSSGK